MYIVVITMLILHKIIDIWLTSDKQYKYFAASLGYEILFAEGDLHFWRENKYPRAYTVYTIKEHTNKLKK